MLHISGKLDTVSSTFVARICKHLYPLQWISNNFKLQFLQGWPAAESYDMIVLDSSGIVCGSIGCYRDAVCYKHILLQWILSNSNCCFCKVVQLLSYIFLWYLRHGKFREIYIRDWIDTTTANITSTHIEGA